MAFINNEDIEFLEKLYLKSNSSEGYRFTDFLYDYKICDETLPSHLVTANFLLILILKKMTQGEVTKNKE
jgi:hypothetical protein